MDRARPTAGDIEFVLLAEAGILERQALLACESLRTFGGALSTSPITVVSPRPPAHRPSRECIDRFERMQVQYCPLKIRSPTPQTGESYKPFALAHVEARPGPAIVVQVDSDTVFVAEPSALAIQSGAAARPVDGPNLCTTGPGDRLDGYWRTLCDQLNIDYEALPSVRTTIGDVTVKANYNGGLLAVARQDGLLQAAAAIYEQIAARGLTPPGRDQISIRTGAGTVSGDAARYFGPSQIAFTLACAASRVPVEVLPPSYNFPAHMLDHYGKAVPSPLVHIHYHWLAEFPPGDANPLLDERMALPPDVQSWLRQRLPL